MRACARACVRPCACAQVVSRALSIYDRVEGGTKHLIPMVDLFNHDPLSPHTLRCSGGMYQVRLWLVGGGVGGAGEGRGG